MEFKVGENVIVCYPWNDAKTYGGQLFYTKINKINQPSDNNNNNGYIFVDGFENEGFHCETLRSGPYAFLMKINKEILTKFYEQEMKELLT